jgi:hypothetical protein
MEKLEEAYDDIDIQCDEWQKPLEDGEKTPISAFEKLRNEKFPQLDISLKDWEIRKAREYPLYRLLSKNKGERIPCPFHRGEQKHFMIKEKGYCFVCLKSVDSICWQMEIKGMRFKEAVRSLS